MVARAAVSRQCPIDGEREPGESWTDRRPYPKRRSAAPKAPPMRVYRAFIEADALAKWLPPHGFTCEVHHMDARVGGGFRMSFRHFGSGHVHTFGGDYLALVPNEHLRYTDRFDDPSLPGEMQVDVRLTAVEGGTDLVIVQDGIPEAGSITLVESNGESDTAKRSRARETWGITEFGRCWLHAVAPKCRVGSFGHGDFGTKVCCQVSKWAHRKECFATSSDRQKSQATSAAP